MLRVIKEVEPPKPSTKLSGSGTLPSIAAERQTEPKKLTATGARRAGLDRDEGLEKDRGRRYETANGLALDVQRYLADEPVLAARRRRATGCGSSCGGTRGRCWRRAWVIGFLVVGIAATSRQAHLAEIARADASAKEAECTKEKDRAERHLRLLEASLGPLLSEADPDTLHNVFVAHAHVAVEGEEATALLHTIGDTERAVDELPPETAVRLLLRPSLALNYLKYGLSFEAAEALPWCDKAVRHNEIGTERGCRSLGLWRQARRRCGWHSWAVPPV